ncbi:hypothetical protein HYALB_00012144 [Hymenoscyphus albidus]|uniref:Uncharacterized protein n=1 Tax=Hymenoscyphus albidus TaxID=595503 RepID=A0A9N9LM06_9HELO|nr:hypothetical protein HYALB_00012144 [Hymenoscyphus albidus]
MSPKFDIGYAYPAAQTRKQWFYGSKCELLRLTKTGDPEVNPPPTPNTLGTSPTTPKTNDPGYTHDKENGTHTSDTNTTTTPKTNDPQSTGDNGDGTNSTVPVVATTNNAAPTSGSLSLVAFTVAMFTVLMV